MSPFQMGVLGTGNIAGQFARGVAGLPRRDGAAGVEVVAVASRSAASAEAFGNEHGIARRHASYDALLADDAVDGVYISLPNTLHHDWTLKALGAGKPVLCEKPLGVSAAEVENMFDAADRAGKLLMEGFMYRCHPLTAAVLDAVRGGVIGTPRLVRASFCYRTRNTDPAGNIRFDPALAGGALMDIGCYCVSYARLIAGEEPIGVSCEAVVGETGVDEYAAGTLRFPGGLLASFTCGMTVQADNNVSICGSDGWIDVPWQWKPPQHNAEYFIRGQTPPRQDNAAGTPPGPPNPERHTADAPAPLYALEALAFARAAREESAPPVTHDDSLGNARTLDRLRRAAGLI